MPASQTIRLTSGARILRGSKRIGTFLAALALLAGAALTITIAYDGASYVVSSYAQAQCLSHRTEANLFADQYGSEPARYRFADNGCPGTAYSVTLAEMRATLAGGPPNFGTTMASKSYLGLTLSVLVAASIFGLCWGLGWVVAGFTAD